MPPAKPLYVQFGCGPCAPESWLNFDASPTLRIERLPVVGRFFRRNAVRFPPNVRIGNIVRGLPVPPESCAGLYGSHVLEHLALDEFRTALANCHRLLRPGGILRVVMPDLEYIVERYVGRKDREPAIAAAEFMRESVLGEESRPRRPMQRLADAIGNSRHRWLWDYAALADEMQRAGFVRIRRCHCYDCDDLRFKEVEDPARFEGALAVECRR